MTLSKIQRHIFCIWNIHSSLAKTFNTINSFNDVCTLLFCFGIQLQTKGTNKKQSYVSSNHGPPLVCSFSCSVWFVNWMPKQKSKVQTALKELIVLPRCVCNFCPTFPKPNGEKNQTNNQWRSMKGGPMSAQPHFMYIIHVCMICWFSHDLGTLPESYLKPREEIQHSQDLNI